MEGILPKPLPAKSGQIMFLRKSSKFLSDKIPGVPKGFFRLLLRLACSHRIGDRPMELLGPLGWKERADLLCAERNDIVDLRKEFEWKVSVKFGVILGDIDTDLLQGFDRVGLDFITGLRTGAMNFRLILKEVFCKTFRHLASSGIRDAEKKDFHVDESPFMVPIRRYNSI